MFLPEIFYVNIAVDTIIFGAISGVIRLRLDASICSCIDEYSLLYLVRSKLSDENIFKLVPVNDKEYTLITHSERKSFLNNYSSKWLCVDIYSS